MNNASRFGNWSIKCIHFSIQRSSQKHTTTTGASTVCTSQICVVRRDIPRAGIATEVSNVHKSPFCVNTRNIPPQNMCGILPKASVDRLLPSRAHTKEMSEILLRANVDAEYVEGTLRFFWGLILWMLSIGGARHPGPCTSSYPSGFSIEFLNVGGWLSRGDLALESTAHFLAIAEHRLVPACARTVTTQLRQARRSSVWAPSCQDVTPGGHAGGGVISLHGAPPFSSHPFRSFLQGVLSYWSCQEGYPPFGKRWCRSSVHHQRLSRC